MYRRIWPAIVLMMVSAFAFSVDTHMTSAVSVKLEQRERQVSATLVRAAQFADVHHVSSQPSCEDVRQPEAVATPDPLLAAETHGKTVKVSFIIGTDGHVHSPLILESAGLSNDRHVLQTVKTWRYRPATCNGAPTETEGKIEFSSR